MRKFNKDRYLKMKLFFNNSKYFYVVLSCLLCSFLGIYFTYSKFFVSEVSKKDSGYLLENVTCTNGDATWLDSLWQLTVNNITKRTKCSLCFLKSSKIEFVYTGNEEEIKFLKSDIYKLKVWVAQSGCALGV